MPRRIDPQLGLGKAVRELRNRAGMSQEVLGARAEIHATWISHIESGRTNPTWGNVRRIANGLAIDLWELAKLAEKFENELS